MRIKLYHLHLIKDLIAVVAIATVFLCIILLIIPRLHEAQDAQLRALFVSWQEEQVHQEVDNMAARVTRMHTGLLASGIPDAAIKRLTFAALEEYRFGMNKDGYFYVLDEAWDIVLHPISPWLVGRSLFTIPSADSRTVGEAFRQGLGSAQEGFVRYTWPRPSETGSSEPKTAYVRKMPDWGITLVAGFYPGEADVLSDSLREVTNAFSRATVRNLLLFALPVLEVFAILSALLTYWIMRLDHSLTAKVANLEQYRLLLDRTSIVSRTTPEGIITYVNDKFTETTGYTAHEALGRKHNIERHPDTSLQTFKELWQTITAGQVWQGILKNRKASGETYLKQATIVPILDDEGRVTEFVSAGQDITALLEEKAGIERAFMTDQLTGLGNRYKLSADLSAFGKGILALVDFVGFTEVNRVFGIPVADEVLRRFSSLVLDSLVLSRHAMYRLGGDRFAIVCRDGEEGGVGDFRAFLRERFGKGLTFEVEGHRVFCEFRIGLAAKGPESLAYAELALDRARESREGMAVWGEEGVMGGIGAGGGLSLFPMLQSAFDEDRVYPAFQPILSLATGRIEKYECLARLRDSTGREVAPGEFLGLAKRTRLYQLLTLRLLEKSVQVFRNRDEDFSINLDMDDLLNRETVAFLTATVKEAGLASRLVVEIVETQDLVESGAVHEVLDELRAMGVRIAIDDFGSGYSNFDYLLRLSPHFVKIDGSIISKLRTDERAAGLVKSLVDFARAGGVGTIAEFVDSEALLAQVRDLGVDYVQGWLVGKAGPLGPRT